jgi:hypothetical protein
MQEAGFKDHGINVYIFPFFFIFYFYQRAHGFDYSRIIAHKVSQG